MTSIPAVFFCRTDVNHNSYHLSKIKKTPTFYLLESVYRALITLVNCNICQIIFCLLLVITANIPYLSIFRTILRISFALLRFADWRSSFLFIVGFLLPKITDPSASPADKHDIQPEPASEGQYPPPFPAAFCCAFSASEQG